MLGSAPPQHPRQGGDEALPQIGGGRLASQLTDTPTSSSARAVGSKRRRADRATTADGLDLILVDIDDDLDDDLGFGDDLGDDLGSAGNQSGGEERAPGDKAASTAAKRGLRYTEDCVTDLDLLEHDFFLKAQELCHKHGISMTSVRQRLGFAVEVGREVNDPTRHSRWFARNKINPFPGDLKKRNRHVKAEWDKVKDDEVRRTALMRKIGIWERKHLAGANEFTAKKSLLKARRTANNFARSLWQNHGISSLLIMVHPHSMMPPSCIAHKRTHNSFADAFQSAETVTHLLQEFQNAVRNNPLPNTVAPKKGSKPGPNIYEPENLDPETQAFTTIRKTAPRELLGTIRAAFQEHGKDSTAWDAAAKGTRRMVWRSTFDLLGDVGLCVEGWPTSARALLLDEARTSNITVVGPAGTAVTRLRVLSGSLQSNSLWSKPVGRRLWGAMCRGKISVVPVPSEDD